MSSLIPLLMVEMRYSKKKREKTENRRSARPVWINKSWKMCLCARRCQKHVRQLHTGWGYEVANFQCFPFLPSPLQHTHSQFKLTFSLLYQHTHAQIWCGCVPRGVAQVEVDHISLSLSQRGSPWQLSASLNIFFFIIINEDSTIPPTRQQSQNSVWYCSNDVMVITVTFCSVFPV